MSNIVDTLKHLVATGDVRISEHGYDELANDGLTAREIVNGINEAILVEDYPNYPKDASARCYKKILMVNQFMSYGVFRRDTCVQQCW